MNKHLFNLAILFISCVCSTFSGCSKGSDPEPEDTYYYICFKANGALTEYKHTAELRLFMTPSGIEYYMVGMAAGDELGNDKFYFSNTVRIGKPLGSYQNDQFIYEYSQLTMTWEQGPSDKSYKSLYSPNNGLTKITSVNFTEETDEYVKGTFSGTLYPEIRPGVLSPNSAVKITEGRFYLKINHEKYN